MKWSSDENHQIKHEIFEIVKDGLEEKYCSKISVKKLNDLIDKFVQELLKEEG